MKSVENCLIQAINELVRRMWKKKSTVKVHEIKQLVRDLESLLERAHRADEKWGKEIE